MNERQAANLIESVLGLVSADGAEAFLDGQRIGFTRYSNERITQNLSSAGDVLTIKVCFGAREGTVRTTDFSRECLEAMVAKAEEIARNSQENPEHVDPLDPAPIAEFGGYHEATEKAGPFDRAKKIRSVLESCSRTGFTCAGMIGNGTLTQAFGNTKGHWCYHKKSWARMHCTVLTPDSSGWSRRTFEDMDAIVPEKVLEAALAKAERSRNPVEVEPGRYTVVLESPAVADLLAFFFFCYNAKDAFEGRSFMAGRQGAKIADERVRIATRPGTDAAPGFPFLPDGLPARDIDWIDKGVSRNLVTDRFWARKLGVEPTGTPVNVLMEGTDADPESLVEGVDRGILVSRFWYVRFVDQMSLLLTGMTRDGSFLIENGRITKGIKNLRWNESVLGVLDRIEAIGRVERQGDKVDALVPSLRVSDFRFSSKTLF